MALVTPASAQRTGPLPKKLVGTWTRTVKSADVARQGPQQVVFKGRWKIAITAYGQYSLYSPKDLTTPLEVSFLGRSATKLIFGVDVCAQKGIYKYAVSGTALTLKLVSDPSCSARRTLLIGV